MKVIYLHGFASSPNSKKVDMLREAGFDVVAPIIDIDPGIAEPYLIKFIIDICNSQAHDEKLVIVGTSLGGFWAARMGRPFDITSILINPAMNPEFSLRKAIGDNMNYKTFESFILTEEIVAKYSNYPVSDDSSRFQTYFIATRDTPVPVNAINVFMYDSDDHQGLSFFPDVIHYLKKIESEPSLDQNEFPDFI